MKKIYKISLIAFILSFCFVSLKAQVLIGEGTDEGQNVPIEAYYGYTYSQSIYLQSEINASGDITAIKWYYSGTSSLDNNQDVVVYMGHTSKTSFDSNTDWIATTAMTEVFNDTIGTVSGAGWITINLSTSFSYNNIDNLVIAVDENTDSYNTSADDFYCSAVSGIRSIYNYSDTFNPDPTSATLTATGTSSYIPNVELVGITQSCPNPSSLVVDNISLDSAQISWLENGTAMSWEINYGASGFTAGMGTTVSATTNPQIIDGLTANSVYDVYIRSICGAADTSGWAGPISFETPCSPLIPSQLENFDAGFTPNSCWNQASSGTPSDGPSDLGFSNWGEDGFGNSGATGAVRINLYTTGVQDWILTPQYDLTSGGPFQVEYDFGVFTYNLTTPANLGSDDEIELLISTDGGTTWTNLATYDNNYTTLAGGNHEVIDLSTYTGVVQFAIYGTDGSTDDAEDNDIFVDNFRVRAVPSCLDPSALMASNLTFTSADLEWTENGTSMSWDIEYDTSGFVPGTGNTVSGVSSNPYGISGLSADTYYDFYVRTDCGADGYSEWVGPYTFFTGYCVPNPSSVDDEGITNVTMGSINNTTSSEVGNYGNYSNLSFLAAQGGTIDCEITFTTGYTYGTKIWVDWNDDLDFDDDDELVYEGISTNNSPTTLEASFDIPVDAALGDHRVRIGGTDDDAGPSDYCYTGFYGSFEDYTITVIEQPTHDVSVSDIVTGSCSNAETIQVTITNNGSFPQVNIPISYVINGGTVVNETWLGFLAPSDSEVYTFPTTFDATTLSALSIEVYSALSTDEQTSNDTTSLVIDIPTIYSTSYQMDFESYTDLPTDWSSDGSIGTAVHNATSTVLYKNLYSFAPDLTVTLPKIGPISNGDSFSFDYRYSDYSTGTVGTVLGAGDTMNIQISTDCGNTFTTFAQIHAGNHTPTADNMTSLEYDLSAYENQTVVFRIYATWGTGDYFLDVDNFAVGGALMLSQSFSSDVSCFGESNGSAEVTVEGGQSPYTYQWSTSNAADTSNSVSGLMTDTYYLTVTDASGQSIIDSFMINEPSEISISFDTSGLSATGTIIASISGGVAPYTYAWDTPDGTSISDTLIVLTNGMYAITVTDSTNCSVDSSITISNIVGIEDIANINQLKVYPNPVKDELNINIELNEKANIAFQIYDVNGQIVHRSNNQLNQSASYKINTSQLAKGLYLIQFVIGQEAISYKFIK